jgi:xylan 1,4-beta-xylosidase
LATRRSGGGLAILLWHYHDDDLAGPDAAVHIALDGAYRARLWRVDQTHANAFSAWRAMGSPPAPSPAQVGALDRASRLLPEPLPIHPNGIDLLLPRQGVALIELASPTHRKER